MDIRVFDQDYNVVKINRKDVVFEKWANKHLEYHTLFKIYHGASNAKEEAELHLEIGFFKIDTKTIINMDFIDHLVKNGVIVNGIYYRVSRELLTELKRQLRKYRRNSH